MDKEVLQMMAMGIAGPLGMLGGYRWKWARRYVLPGLLGIIAALAGFILWQWLVLSLGLAAAFCLPYGERTPYWGKCLVAVAYVLPTLALGLTWWQAVLPPVFVLLFWLSNKTRWVPWKVWEFIVFSGVGVIVAALIK